MASQGWRQRWVEDKRGIAARLAQGEAGGSYPEAVILLCAALSALSAELWPGRGIDRLRFVESLVRLGSHSALCRTVSVPLLTQSLEARGMAAEANQLRQAFGLSNTARVLTGSEIDKPEAEVLAACPSLSLADARRFSYANLLYQEVRTSYARECRPGDTAGSWPMTMAPDQQVSYINRLAEATMRVQRLIHFHVEWLGDLAVALAASVDGSRMVPHPMPGLWWADGG